MSHEIDYMQEAVEGWLNKRPLLDKRESTLRTVVEHEEIELEEALSEGNPQNIRSEAGDVLFSRIAAHMDTTAMITQCQEMGLDPLEIFNETHDKNRINYVWIFFSQYSPFDSASLSTKCLRLFREKYKTPEKLDKVWLKLDHYIYDKMAFHDHYWITGRFRKFIKKELIKISKSKNKQNAETAKDLMQQGFWDDIRFVIE